jgi:hypothetical protein
MLLVQKTAPASLQPNISTSSHADITHASSDNSATINGYTEKQQTVHRQSPPSLIETGAKKLVGKVAATAMDMTLDNPSATQITRDIAENPQETLAYIKQIADTGEFTSLLADAEIQDILEKQDTEALLENGKFQNLLATENMQGLLANMHNDSSGKTPEQLIADTMMQGWNRMDAMKKDPRVNAILADPEFREELNNGNNMRLLMNPKMKELTEILFNKPDAQAQDTQTQDTQTQDTDTTAENLSDNPGMADGINALQETLANESKAAASKPEIETEKPIYRWVDENGSVHFSDHEKGSDETRQ